MDYTLRFFRAMDDLPSCCRYATHHQKILKNYHVGAIESTAHDWMYNDQSYLILAHNADSDELLGGGRIQIKSADDFLPVERALGDYKGNIEANVSGGDAIMAELCGVWFNKRAAGYGLSSIVLIRFAIAIAKELKINALLGFCSPYTKPIIEKTGGRIVTSLGENGCFMYPTKEMVSTLLVYEDLTNLPLANEEERFRIQSLRRNAYSSTTTIGQEGMGRMHYKIFPDSIDQIAYSG